MTINEAMQALCDELTAGNVPAPLHQPFTLALIWADLCRLAGEEPPADVRALIEGTTAALQHVGDLISTTNYTVSV